MKLARALTGFSVTFVLLYPFAVFNSWSMFRYYPSIHTFSFVRLSAGNAIQWYGWLVTCLIAGLVVGGIAYVLPERGATSNWLRWVWIVPVIAILGSLWVVTVNWWLS
jgi:hypothetical protein